MINVDFQTLEGSYTMPCGITVETWFITKRRLFRSPQIIRRELYKAEDGSVVGICDSGKGIKSVLSLDEQFLTFFNGEPAIDAILSDQGILDPGMIETYRTED